MVAIAQNDLLRELVAEAAKSQRQPGDITVREFCQEANSSRVNLSLWQARKYLDDQVVSGKLIKIRLDGKNIVYRKATK